jgi:hypothetical protein
MRPGEIYLANFPFGDTPGMKLRPVLLLTGAVGSIPEILVAYISSVLPAQTLPSDLLIDPTRAVFKSTNLKTISTLRLHKLATIHPVLEADQPDHIGRIRMEIKAASSRRANPSAAGIRSFIGQSHFKASSGSDRRDLARAQQPETPRSRAPSR